MTEQRKNEIESMAKEMFMKGIDDLIDENSSPQAIHEYAAGCTAVAKIFYGAFDKITDQ